MHIGYSRLGSDNEFGYGHDESDSIIGETKSTAYPTGKAGVYPIFCRMVQEFLLETSHSGIAYLS